MAVAKTTMKTAHHVKDLHLAPKGHGRIEWAERSMPVLPELPWDSFGPQLRLTLQATFNKLEREWPAKWRDLGGAAAVLRGASGCFGVLQRASACFSVLQQASG